MGNRHAKEGEDREDGESEGDDKDKGCRGGRVS